MPPNETHARAERQPVERTSPDIAAEQLAKLRRLSPEVFTEGQVDFDKLRATLGQNVAAGPERFSFTWAGKSEAVALLQTPSHATLIPCPEESVHFATTANAFIEGDNLEVLKLLFKPYFGRVKLIYIDPPYNTGQDFVYPDDYADPLATYLRLTGQMDAAGNLLTSNPETSGRYHSAWLSMMYPRLFLARQLLREDGIICVSIDDHEVHHLRMLMNEVFGEENFVAQVTCRKVYGGGAKVKHVVDLHEYVVCYARDKEEIPFISLPPDPKTLRLYKHKDEKFERRGPYYTQPLATTSMDERKNLRFPIIYRGEEIWSEKQWQWSKERVEAAMKNDELVFKKTDGKWSVRYKQYLRDEDGIERGTKPFSILTGPYTQEGTEEISDLLGDNKVFPFPKPTNLVKHFLQYSWQDKDAIILDFFAGSCTTAQAVLELNHEDGGNRRFIMVQLPEPTGNKDYPTIAEIGKERIRRVIAKLKKEAEGKLDLKVRDTPEDLSFKVFKLAQPHIRPWAPDGSRDADTYAGQLALFNDPLAPGWEPENVLWEVALREGYGLNTRFEKKALSNGHTLYEVSDPDSGQSFAVCLDDALRADLSRCCDLTPDRLFVCRDVALDDTAAANLALQCRLKTI